ncbi:hypothetical protein DMH15_43050, partial [Streptomyces sp. WAC 06725]
APGATGSGLGRADRTELYRQAGGLLRRLHDACGTAVPAGGADRRGADRPAAPALGHAHAPSLVDSDPARLALLLTAAPAPGATGSGLGRADRTELYRQAGGLLRRLHDACGTAVPAGGAD